VEKIEWLMENLTPATLAAIIADLEDVPESEWSASADYIMEVAKAALTLVR
jgi:hypothetical protein